MKISCCLCFVFLLTFSLCAEESTKAFPEAQGFGAFTPGGRGGKVIRVSTLEARGKGSLEEALQSKGPRIIVFEVGGVIDLNGKSLSIEQPFVTLAGQTAPSPGITLIKGGLEIKTHDVIVRHLSVRPGEAGRAKKSGWEKDGVSTNGAANVIIDHCSCTWATDENLSASGARFKGKTPEEWRENTSHNVTISNCIIAEGLSKSTHKKGDHSKGSLIHDNTTNVAVISNLYVSNVERNPLTKGGVHAVIANNWIVNPQRRAMHNAIVDSEWKGQPFQASKLAIVGNVLEHGQNTTKDCTLFYNHRESPLELYMEDNLAFDVTKNVIPLTGGFIKPLLKEKPLWPTGFAPLPADKVKEHLTKNVGSRPWDRDEIDERILRGAAEGTAKVIDSEQEVGGYPKRPATQSTFDADAWNLETMERKDAEK